LLPLQREAGGTVLGVDWRLPLDEAWKRIGYDRAIQGNLDPLLLCAPPEVAGEAGPRDRRRRRRATGARLQPGPRIIPETPVDQREGDGRRGARGAARVNA